MAKSNIFLSDKKWLNQKYTNEGLSTVEIAKIINVNPSSVNSALKRNDIRIRNSAKAAHNRKGKRRLKYAELNDKAWLFQKYITEQLTTYEVADLIGANQKAVMVALNRHKIPTRNRIEAGKLREYESGFQQLNDKNWLYEQYVTNKKSSIEIGEMIGCNGNNVVAYLRKYNIPIRDAKEARHNVPLQSFKYDQLNDKDWLYQKYIVDGLSTQNISDLVEVKTANSVRQALLRNDIEVRNISDGLTRNREDDGFILNQSVIDGCLLGDAGLKIYNRKSEISNPNFYKKNKFKDHVEYVYDLLLSKKRMQIKQDVHKAYDERFKKEFYTCYGFRTLSHKILKPIYEKWYPKWNNYKKVVPRDIQLTPEVLLHWFLDDGSSHLRKRKDSSKRQIVIILCSESFNKEDNEFLSFEMKRIFNLKSTVTSYNQGKGDRYRIYIPQSQADLFYDIIGSPPVASLSYKWK